MFATIRTTAIIAVTAMSAFAGSSAAVSAPADDTRSMIVSYNDLDLKSDAGVARLDQRIRTALGTVCGSANTRDLAARAHVIECRRVAMNAVRPNVELAVANARSDTQLALSTAAIRVDAR